MDPAGIVPTWLWDSRPMCEALARMRTQDDTVGGGAVLPQTLRHVAHAHRMLDESDYSATVSRELLDVTADLGIETGWFAHNANEQTLARQLYGMLRCWPTMSK